MFPTSLRYYVVSNCLVINFCAKETAGQSTDSTQSNLIRIDSVRKSRRFFDRRQDTLRYWVYPTNSNQVGFTDKRNVSSRIQF